MSPGPLRLLRQACPLLGQGSDLGQWAGFGRAFDSFKINKLKAIKPIPIMESAIVGVKIPESETSGSSVGEGVAEPVAIGVPEAVAVGEALGVAVAVPEGVDSKAGPSAA